MKKRSKEVIANLGGRSLRSRDSAIVTSPLSASIYRLWHSQIDSRQIDRQKDGQLTTFKILSLTEVVACSRLLAVLRFLDRFIDRWLDRQIDIDRQIYRQLATFKILSLTEVVACFRLLAVPRFLDRFIDRQIDRMIERQLPLKSSH